MIKCCGNLCRCFISLQRTEHLSEAERRCNGLDCPKQVGPNRTSTAVCTDSSSTSIARLDCQHPETGIFKEAYTSSTYQTQLITDERRLKHQTCTHRTKFGIRRTNPHTFIKLQLTRVLARAEPLGSSLPTYSINTPAQPAVQSTRRTINGNILGFG